MRYGEGRRSSRAGVVLGVGMGGFVDGIVLHQLMHWHNMGSAVLRPDTLEALKRNMVWDGLFHAGTWLVTLAGILLLWSDAREGRLILRGRALAGQMLLGFGLFNLVEGGVNHHILGLHHVRDLPVHVPLYDWLFLGIMGVGMIALGWLLTRPRRDPLRRR